VITRPTASLAKAADLVRALRGADPSSRLEGWGLRYLRQRAEAVKVAQADDAIHVLNDAEQAALRRIERRALARAALAGALSAAASAGAEVWVQSQVAHGTPATAGVAPLVLAVTAVATLFEMAFLYWDSLRSVHALAAAAGLELFPPGSASPNAVATALARAALELPNRPDPLLGVDPHRDSSKLVLLLGALLYKAKVAVTSIVAKALIRRVGGRALAKAYLAFVAVPVTALWNAWVVRTVLREARLRVMGPSAVHESIAVLLRDRARPASAAGVATCLRAVGCAAVRKRDLHPNLELLLVLLGEKLGARPAGDERLDDRPAFLRDLAALPADEQDMVLAVLSVALVIDGRLSRRERAFWHEAESACGRPPDDTRLRRLHRRFVRGEGIAHG
jgi:hypothetical protein